MFFSATKLPGVYLIEPERRTDERGFFARTFDEAQFAANNLSVTFSQCSIAFNATSGTFRGMHFQKEPHPEDKLVRCTMGSAYDIVLDLRADSPTFCGWIATELTAENRMMVYIPAGCAHGYLTLAPNTELFYQISGEYCAQAASGVRWSDPSFKISLPALPALISPRDLEFPDFTS